MKEAEITKDSIAAYINKNPEPLFLRFASGKGATNASKGRSNRKDAQQYGAR